MPRARSPISTWFSEKALTRCLWMIRSPGRTRDPWNSAEGDPFTKRLCCLTIRNGDSKRGISGRPSEKPKPTWITGKPCRRANSTAWAALATASWVAGKRSRMPLWKSSVKNAVCLGSSFIELSLRHFLRHPFQDVSGAEQGSLFLLGQPGESSSEPVPLGLAEAAAQRGAFGRQLEIHLAPVGRVRPPLQQAELFQQGHGHGHGLGFDPFGTGELRRRRGAVLVQPLEHRRLRPGKMLQFGRGIGPDPAHDQADGGGKVLDHRLGGLFRNHAVTVKLNSLTVKMETRVKCQAFVMDT